MKQHRALSVRQPWADLIGSGLKSIECRSWTTNYRGPLVICASNVLTADDRALYDRIAAGGDVPREPRRGVAVCMVDLVDVRPGKRNDRRLAFCDVEGSFAWVLARPRPLRPIGVNGRVSLFWLDGACVRLAS